jgi:NAD kinase
MSAVALKAGVSMPRTAFEKVVIVTRKTELEELVARFNTVAQSRFYLEHAGRDFTPIEAAHEHFHGVLDGIRGLVPKGLKQQVIERSFLPQFTFGEADLVVTVGPDGLVVNVAKYLEGQPILPINPDPAQIDGILLPFTAQTAGNALARALRREQPIKAVTMAEARTRDGQTLLGFNDLFIGARSHVSARYEIAQGKKRERQSSSGIIVSTGAGSTGWLQSVYAGAASVVKALGGHVIPPVNGGRLSWDTEALMFAVREPFPSKTTGIKLTFGTITRAAPLELTSHMAENGVIFSDGIETDYLAFNAGTTITIGIARRQAKIIVG